MPEGCPTCAVEGTPSNLCCAYDPGGSRELPYIETEGLGEGNTPLVPLRTEGASLAKLEFINPTGSHKDRYSAQAVAHAVHAGYRCVCVASSGNAGLSVAAYAARAGVECRVVVTPVVPRSLLDAVSATGASVHVVTGSDARWDLIRSWTGRDGGVLSLSNTVSPVIGSSPFGIEGYKAIAWELHDRLGRVPDAVLVPTSRGDLLSGIALGFAGMAAGPSARVPRVYCVEPFARASAVLDGAAPVTADFPGDATATPSIGGHGVTYQTVAALRATGGRAVVVGPQAASRAAGALRGDGLLVEAAGAVAYAAEADLRASGEIADGELSVCLLTSHLFKGL